MSWFSKLFSTAKTDLETLANHVEAEYAALRAELEAKITALEDKVRALVMPLPTSPPSPPSEPAPPAA